MKDLAMLTIPALSKALELSSNLPPSSKSARDAKIRDELEEYIASLIKLDEALHEAEASEGPFWD